MQSAAGGWVTGKEDMEQGRCSSGKREGRKRTPRNWPVECPRTGPLERGAGEVFLPAGHDNLALR